MNGNTLPDIPHIAVDGVGNARVVPDMATIIVELKHVDDDVVAAKDEVDRRSEAVIRLARKAEIQPEDLTSTQIAIGPEYTWSHNSKKYLGTSVRREVTLILRNLSRYSEVIHGLAEVPITSLIGITMDVENRSEVEQSALREAIANAKATAATMAAELGVTLGAAHSINSFRTFHIGAVASTDLDRGAQAFEPGSIEVTKQVNVVFNVETDTAS